MCCPVECLIELACRTRLMRSTHTCQARSMNRRQINQDFSNSNLTQVSSAYLSVHLCPLVILIIAFPRGSVIQRELFRWHHGSPGGWFVSIKPSVIVFDMIAQLLMQRPLCWKCVPWFATEKNEKWYTDRFYEVDKNLWEQSAAMEPMTGSKEDVGVCCPWIVSQLCFSGCVYLSPPLSALTECLRDYNSD